MTILYSFYSKMTSSNLGRQISIMGAKFLRKVKKFYSKQIFRWTYTVTIITLVCANTLSPMMYSLADDLGEHGTDTDAVVTS